MINITFPDGNVREYEAGATAMDIAKSISEGLARNVLSARINGEVWDAHRPIADDSKIELLTWNCLLYTSPSPRDRTRSRMPSSA